MKELEEKRINKEMANIRKKFKGQWFNPSKPHTANCLIVTLCLDGNLDGYQKKKSVSSLYVSVQRLNLWTDMLPKSSSLIFSVIKSTSDTWKLSI